MSSTNDSLYTSSIRKISFGRLLEKALNSVLVDQNKAEMISNFIDDNAAKLYTYKFETYKLMNDDCHEDEDGKKEKSTETDKTLKEEFRDQQINKFGNLITLDESQIYIEKNLEIISEETFNYLQSWAIHNEVENNFIAMERLAHQAMIIQHVYEIMNQSKLESVKSTEMFFENMKCDQYQQEFYKKLENFRDLLRDHSEQVNKDSLGKTEEKDREKRLGPGGLDPIQVIQLLPKVLVECFKSRDLQQLQYAFSKMSREKATKYLDCCVKSGLLVQNSLDTEDMDMNE